MLSGHCFNRFKLCWWTLLIQILSFLLQTLLITDSIQYIGINCMQLTFKTEVLIAQSKANLGYVHTAPFLLVPVSVASKLPVNIAPFSYKNGVKNIRLCPFTSICLIKKLSEKYPLLCIRIAKFWWNSLLNIGAFSKPPFLCVPIDLMRFQKLRLCGYPLLTAFSKTSAFIKCCMVISQGK